MHQGLIPALHRPLAHARAGWLGIMVCAVVALAAAAARPAEAGDPGEAGWIAITYAVVEGDTIESIAGRFALSPDSVRWNNPEVTAGGQLEPGDLLQIPGTDGIIYRVRRGDTLAQIARRHGVPVVRILRFAANNLPRPRKLSPGRLLLIPGGTPPDGGAGGYARTTDNLNLRRGPSLEESVITVMPRGSVVELLGPVEDGFYPVRYVRLEGWASADYLELLGSRPPRPRAGGRLFVWPATGDITSYFGPDHPLGIDIGLARRTPVRAVRDGTVIFTGGRRCCSYGLYVIVEHDRTFTTLYAHFSQVTVEAGQQVLAGEVLGLSGSSGYSTGPHLHFEIRRNGKPLDPLRFLPR